MEHNLSSTHQHNNEHQENEAIAFIPVKNKLLITYALHSILKSSVLMLMVEWQEGQPASKKLLLL